MHCRSVARLLVATAIAIAAGAQAMAQSWPSTRITLVVPFTPGGSTDILARLLGQKLEVALGQPVIIENRPGAGGSIASAAVARSTPDGTTLIVGHIGTLAVNPGLYAKLPYDPVKSFEPISLIAKVHNVLVVHPGVPAKSVAELIDYARRNPGKLNYATGGNGSAAHMAIIAFSLAAGLDMVHVPYRGTGPALQDLISGQVQLTMTGAPTVLEHARSGLLRGLAVSSANRIEAAPDLPTIAEAALPGFEASQWYGVLAPAGTPRAIVDRLNAEVRNAITAPEVAQRLVAEGAEPWVSTPEAFRAHIAQEIAVWGDIIRRANVPLIGKAD